MVFGIDLGTTNSLIGSGDKMYSSLVSSNVDVVKKKQVPRDYYSSDVVSSYKTDMSMGTSGQLALKCSSIILKELAEQAMMRSGQSVRDVVISVPAYFSSSQREAVKLAATEAGLVVRGLLNEPTAAALYVCRDIKDIVVVFDLGGGTFDVSIVDSRLGNYKVIATDGLVIGGDTLDKIIVEDMLKELHIRIKDQTEACLAEYKILARAAKERIQQTGEDTYVGDTTYLLTVPKYKKFVKIAFGDTISTTIQLIGKNIPASEQLKFVFVGGSTSCPYLRQMVQEEISMEIIDCDCKPDMVVAKGVALYAKLVEEGIANTYIEDVTKRLCIEDDTGMGITIVESNTIIPCRHERCVTNTKRDTKLALRLYQGAATFVQDNDYIGTLIYEYDHEMEAGEGVVQVVIEVSVDGVIVLKAYEPIYGEEAAEEIKLYLGDKS